MMDMERAMMLHRKECPFDHRCRATDCMECTELYDKSGELSADAAAAGQKRLANANVDGLASK